jgi:hypothetical protein
LWNVQLIVPVPIGVRFCLSKEKTEKSGGITPKRDSSRVRKPAIAWSRPSASGGGDLSDAGDPPHCKHSDPDDTSRVEKIAGNNGSNGRQAAISSGVSNRPLMETRSDLSQAI